MSSFSECLAHNNDPLPIHLAEVANDALKAAKGAGRRIEHAVLLMGLLHDVGKATSWFQERIQGHSHKKDKRSHHARLSALIASQVVSNLVGIPDEERTWLRYAVIPGIAKHHANLTDHPKDIIKLLRQDIEADPVYREQMDHMQMDGFASWLVGELARHGIACNIERLTFESVSKALRDISPLFEKPFNTFDDGMDFVSALGFFLGSDKMHAAFPQWQPKRYELGPEMVASFKRKRFDRPVGRIERIRDEIFDEVLTTLTANPNSPFYAITAPTGSGKTLTGLAAGLAIKARKQTLGRSRLVYCLPFTSIIDQNSTVYQDVLEANGLTPDSDLLLTHHHLSDLTYRRGDEFIEDGADLLVETWQSEIVVTTFYQLLYTFFSSRNANLKRLSALKNAVVILDEAQAIPHRYWEDIRTMFRYAVDKLGTTFILMTATMPLILQTEEVVELLPSYESRFEGLSRTKIVNQTNKEIRLDELRMALLERIQETPDISRIVILNRRSPVRDLFRHLAEKQQNVHMLSTDLRPLDRSSVLERIRRPFTLVTTQLIEAGVDISADEVWRDIAPLDAIVQSAGRCNRHWERQEGPLNLVQLVDGRGRMAVPPYDGFLVETTLEALSQEGQEIVESRFHKLASNYYYLLKERSEQADVKNLLEDGAVHKIDGPEGFVLISELPRQTYFIMRDDRDREIWEAFNALEGIRDFFERRKRFRAMRREFMERVVQQLRREPTSEVIPIYENDERYSPVTGLEGMDEGYEVI